MKFITGNYPGDHKRLGQYVKSKKIKKVDAEEERKIASQISQAVDRKKDEIARNSATGSGIIAAHSLRS